MLGLLFLRYADGRYAEAEKQLKPRPGSRLGTPTPDAFKARGVIFLTKNVLAAIAEIERLIDEAISGVAHSRACSVRRGYEATV